MNISIFNKKWDLLGVMLCFHFIIISSFNWNVTFRDGSVLLVVVATGLTLMKRYKLSEIQIRNIKYIFVWYLLFVILAVLSLKWSYEDTSNSPFFTAMFRILPILLCICIYINSWEKVVSFLKMWITAITIMAILALLTSGIENYGSIGYGGITNQWRNEIGHLSAIAAVIAFILNKMEKKKKYNYIVIIINIFSVICTGSRGALMVLAFFVVLYGISEPSLNKRVHNILVLIMLFLVTLVLIFNVPFLNAIFGERLQQAFMGLNSSDMSTIDRSTYLVNAMTLFHSKPLLGWGIDAFRYAQYSELNFRTIVYSHTNYGEILADLGIVGFVTYYWYYIFILYKSYKNKNTNFLIRLVFLLILYCLVFEVETIRFYAYMEIYLMAIMGAIILMSLNVNKKIIFKG